jgi:hypothetical protein
VTLNQDLSVALIVVGAFAIIVGLAGNKYVKATVLTWLVAP